MKDSSNPELPQASEKLSYKFILDALKEKHMKQFAQPEGLEVEATPPLPEPLADAHHAAPLEVEICGTQADNEPSLPPEESVQIQDLELPVDKKYFRIGEVAELVGVEPYVLRYWESEFKLVKPVKSGSGHRVYGRKDVEALHMIRHLLHVEKFSIKGAKKKLLDRKRSPAQAMEKADLQKNQQWLKGLAHELKDLLHLAKTGNPGGF